MPKKKSTAKKPKTTKARVDCVNVRPAACPKCSCTDRTKKQSVVKRHINGTLQPGNIRYTVVQWNYCNCANCGHKYRFIEYLNPKSRPKGAS